MIACPLVQSLGINLPPQYFVPQTAPFTLLRLYPRLHARAYPDPGSGVKNVAHGFRGRTVLALHGAEARTGGKVTHKRAHCGIVSPLQSALVVCRAELSVLLDNVTFALLGERIASKLVHKSARLDRTGVAQYLALVVCQTPELERGNACLEGGNHTGVGPRAREGL